MVWPTFAWPLSTLTEVQRASWERDGYLVIPDAVSRPVAAAAAAAIHDFVGADPAVPATWYTNTLDIYKDRTASGAKPHHGPCGMVQLNHHRALWALRQEPRVHGAFADLYGTRRLFVTADRAHFKPPEHPEYPAWSDPGDVHVGLHWDVDTRRVAWPVPYVIQGVVYLNDTTAQQGALRVVPGFHRQFEEWDATQPANRSAERPEGKAARSLGERAVAVEAAAGSLVVWHSLLPHGPAPNRADAPRVSAYVSMLPVDAAPFLGPGKSADTPLNMVDAGTLSYMEGLDPSKPAVTKEACDGACGAGDPAEMCTPSSDGGSGGAAGKPGISVTRVQRQSRQRRSERYLFRLPLLDEDPHEGELPHKPPGEEDAPLAELTPLGQRLVGLVEWAEDADGLEAPAGDR